MNSTQSNRKRHAPESGAGPAEGEAHVHQESQPRQRKRHCQEAGQQAQSGPRQQESRSDRTDEARQRRDAGRDHGRHRMASAHGARLRQHPRQQGRGEDRLVQERRGRTDVQDREIASGNSSSKRRLGHAPGAAFLLLRPRVSDVTDPSRHWVGRIGRQNHSYPAMFRGGAAQNAVSWGRKRPWWRFRRGGGHVVPLRRERPATGKK